MILAAWSTLSRLTVMFWVCGTLARSMPMPVLVTAVATAASIGWSVAMMRNTPVRPVAVRFLCAGYQACACGYLGWTKRMGNRFPFSAR